MTLHSNKKRKQGCFEYLIRFSLFCNYLAVLEFCSFFITVHIYWVGFCSTVHAGLVVFYFVADDRESLGKYEKF